MSRPDKIEEAVMLPPSDLFPGLYQRVGSSELFQKMKRFADAVPKEAPGVILQNFRSNPPRGADDLHTFIERWFELPSDVPSDAGSVDTLSLRSYIAGRWTRSTIQSRDVPPHSSLISMPGRFITSGGLWREQYYWNTYFLMVGLGAQHSALKTEMVGNIASLIDRFGHVPNGNRTYYLSRSQPPLFFSMLSLLNPMDEALVFAEHLPLLQKEHAYWMAGEESLKPGEASRHAVRLTSGAILNRYWDDCDTPRDEAFFRDSAIASAAVGRSAAEVFRDIRAGAESGWDYSSRWFADRQTMATIVTTSIVPVDLNSFIYGLEQAIASGCARSGDHAGAAVYQGRAAARRAAMNEVLWNEKLGLFDDYDWKAKSRRAAVSAAMLAPLFVKLATEEQALSTARRVRKDLLEKGGLLNTNCTTGEQWDAPYGFAANQWIAVEGLRRYGLDDDARDIAGRWLAMTAGVYEKTGRLFEKYDVVECGPGGGGGYPIQSGQGWTASITLALLDLYPDFSCFGDAFPALHSQEV
ncbi:MULTISPECIES: trehalase family glycosidase [unclassified Neorhizobium]|uniref:trehalase family glycosidase n=1 Tax=unclassified Neorhizobium TaxID=2629175 RepID=UPI001FF6DCC7|nr:MULTISPECIES: trehalase family glycosidase [unclassified Neorhizobium]MCJ9669939.1 alpha,alpha-trehalase [Neorhizobium sp. SHOUNA12B]MCJ9744756.1 alpha,alpha-trehalase [Neorhizobium sp. SHOUNA12A]